MDETRELTSKSVTESAAAKDSQRSGVEQLARSLGHAGFDFDLLAGMALEGILELLRLERGFFFLGSSGDGGATDSASLRPVAVRARRAHSAPSEWVEVRNPEFAVSRSVIKRALIGGRAVSINDCLLEPTPDRDAQHRAVLCQPVELAPGVRGVLYLDRELGGGELGESQLAVLQDFASTCLVALGRAFALRELTKAREVLSSSEAPSDSPDGDGPDADSAEGPSVDPEESPTFFGIVGRDPKLQKLLKIVQKIKNSDLSVCIFGESGTGKELLARAVHASSNRGEKPFVAENCGAIPENLLESELFGHVKGSFTGADEDKQGLFEVASGGTLFLDEIGDMSESMQRKLLRVLQEGVMRPIGAKATIRVDVRVLCASNRDLKVLVQKGEFRADLYYRLNVITLELPPLRDRTVDIPPLVKHLAARIGTEEGIKRRFSTSAMKALTEYPWPGNIRELTNVLRRAIITCPRKVIARKDIIGLLSNVSAAPRTGQNMDRDDNELCLRVPVRDSFNKIIEECERVVLLNALKQCAWNKSKVTKALKIPRQSLYNKIAKYKLERTWD